MENKMLDMFETVGELLTIKGMDKLIDEYAKTPDSERAKKHGLRMKLCSMCVKQKPDMMRKLAMLETGKTAEEMAGMDEKEYASLMLRTTLELVAPFLAPAPSGDGIT